MNIGNYYISKRQIIVFIILFLGLTASVYLVLNRQIFKSRANLVSNSFLITQDTEPPQPAECSGNTCITETLNIVIRPNLQANLQGEPQNPIPAQVTLPAPPTPTPSPSPTPTPTPSVAPSNTNLATCAFYRQGVGQTFQNSAMPALITQIAGKVGVPASALAGILRIESPEPFSSFNNTYVINDYDAHSSGIAYGLMQFVPPTFNSVFNSNRTEMQSSFGKTAVQTTIEPQKYPAPQDNILRITSIKDSLTAAAFKIRADAGSSPPYNRQAVSNILSAYFGSHCGYEGGGADYCSDMLRGMSECGGI